MKKLYSELLQLSLKGLTVSALSWFALSATASTLEDISFQPSGTGFEVRLGLDDTAGLSPEIYVIDQPARIVLDLPDVQNAIDQKQYPLAIANAKDAVLLGTDDRTRLVLNLSSTSDYDYAIQGDTLVLTVAGSGSGSSAAPFAPSSSSASPSVRSSVGGAPTFSSAEEAGLVDFQFRRGADGEGNLMLEFNTDRVNADISQSGGVIRLSFFESTVEESLLRVFDVQDFATPVGTVSVRQVGEEARIEIRTVDEYDYLAYQADNSYVVSISPLTPAQEAEREKEFAYTGEPMTLNFQDIPVRSVLQLIADVAQLNLVASDSVTDNITLILKNVPWDQALDIVLRTKGLDKRQEGNILLIAPLAEIAERERLEVEANKQLEELAPLVTEFVRIRYADAEDLFNLLAADSSVGGGSQNQGQGQGTGEQANENLLSERGSAIVDSRTNTIILTDVQDKIDGFKAIIEQLDIPIQQVLIEARIVVADTSFRRELGVRWGIGGTRSVSDGDLDVGFGLRNSTGVDSNAFPVTDFGVVGTASNLALSFLTDSTLLGLELQALQEEGHGEIISQPKIVTGDKQTAEIRSGQEIAFNESTSSGAAALTFREAVLSLEVTPQITPDNRVILDLVINQDAISDQEEEVPLIDINELTTQVLVNNGETLVLGGIYQTSKIHGEEKVPFLGDLPYIGNAFKSTAVEETKQEILFFITPKILAEDLSVR